LQDQQDKCCVCFIHLSPLLVVTLSADPQVAGAVLPKCRQRRGYVHKRGHGAPQGAQPAAGEGLIRLRLHNVTHITAVCNAAKKVRNHVVAVAVESATPAPGAAGVVP
jgi:hypothetical protein